jgi:mannose-6-phosphate isomerase
MINYTEERPWGNFENLLDTSYTKVKEITVNPGERLSYQYHHKRSEHWIVVKGTATVVLDDNIMELDENMSVFIPKTSKHRLWNKTSKLLKVIEVQTGDYFGEDDIVRLEDDYSRG